MAADGKGDRTLSVDVGVKEAESSFVASQRKPTVFESNLNAIAHDDLVEMPDDDQTQWTRPARESDDCPKQVAAGGVCCNAEILALSSFYQ